MQAELKIGLIETLLTFFHHKVLIDQDIFFSNFHLYIKVCSVFYKVLNARDN